VSVHDNFLDIGGHSLLALRAIARIAKRTGVRVGQSAFNLQTLEQIAAQCEQRSDAETSPEPPAEPPPRLAQRFVSAVRQTLA
jgi:hypothetical protein